MSDQQGSGQFEQDWREALSAAHIEAPAGVWQQLDQALTHAELVVLKRRLSTYKWATITAIGFGLIAAIIALTSRYNFFLGEASGDIVVVPKEYQSPEDQVLDGNFAGYAILRTNTDQSTSPERGVDASAPTDVVPPTVVSSNAFVAAAPEENSNPAVMGSEQLDEFDTRATLGPLVARSVPAATVEAVDHKHRWVQKVPDYHYYRPVRASSLEPEKRRFWAGLNLGTGYYNPNYEGGAQLDFVNDIIKSEGEAGKQESLPELSEGMKGGTSYMLGFNMGMNLNQRWSLEGGMQYSLQGARSLSNLILESDKFNQALAVSSEVIGINAVTSLTEDALTVLSADETELTNTFQFVSVPLQAGYLLIDKRVSIRVNGGLSANLYLGNRLGGTDRVDEVQINRQNSPYRALNLGALTGVEFGYRIFDQFHISVEPVYQRSLHSLTKSTTNFVTNPSTIGIETGLRYSF